MQTASAVLLVLVAASAISAAADEHVMLREWLSVQKSGKARPAYDGSEAENVHACLQAIAVENCQTLSFCAECSAPYNSIYFETKLGCCHGHGYSHEQPERFFKDVEQASVGSCWWTYNLLDDPVPSTTGSVIGTFYGTCELKDNAEKCGEVFCDDMVLKGWGKVHVIDVAIEGQPTAQSTDGCRFFFGGRHVAKPPAVEPPAAKKSSNGEKAGVQISEYHHSKVQYYKASAIVFSGYVNTYSFSHNLKVKEGHIQFVPIYKILSDPISPIEPSPGELILRPYEITMELKKAADH